MFIENIQSRDVRPRWGRTHTPFCLSRNIRCRWYQIIFTMPNSINEILSGFENLTGLGIYLHEK